MAGRFRNYPQTATKFSWPDHPPLTPTGLDFPISNAGNSNVRLIWTGANLLPRTAHTAIWKAQYKQPNVESGTYIAVAWHSPNTGTWDAGTYSYGTHPYPASDGTYSGAGQALTGDAGASGIYWQEMAGVGAAEDHIAIPMTPAMQVVFDGRWLTQARTVEVSGANIVHRFYPDVGNFPSKYIEKTITTASIGSPSNPAFYLGSSDWTGTGDTNNEAPCCVLRHILLYNAALDITTIQAKAALTSDDSGGSVWYSNINPTPSDITDKSGAGHTPVWFEGRLPGFWEG